MPYRRGAGDTDMAGAAALIIFISHDTNVLHEPAHDLHRDEPQVTTDLEFEKKSVPWQLVMLARRTT